MKTIRTEHHLILTIPSGKLKLPEDVMHGERMEHARAQFALDLIALKDKRVNAIMRKWGITVQENGKWSTIAYAKDFKNRVHEKALKILAQTRTTKL